MCSPRSLLLGHGDVSLLVLCGPPDRDVVMAVVLCYDAHAGPLLLVVVRIMCDELDRVCHVQTKGLDGVL